MGKCEFLIKSLLGNVLCVVLADYLFIITILELPFAYKRIVAAIRRTMGMSGILKDIQRSTSLESNVNKVKYIN